MITIQQLEQAIKDFLNLGKCRAIIKLLDWIERKINKTYKGERKRNRENDKRIIDAKKKIYWLCLWNNFWLMKKKNVGKDSFVLMSMLK